MSDGTAFLERARKGNDEHRQVRYSEQDLTDFVDNAPLAFHWLSADGTILWANRAELELLGVTEGEYVGQPVAAFHADPTIIGSVLHRLKSGETLLNYEARLLAKDGSVKHVLISSNARWAGGTFLHTRCFTQDITARRKAEEALHASEERFIRFMEHLPGAAWMKDLDGRYLYANKAAEEFFSKHRGGIIGKTDEDIFPAELSSHLAENDRLAVSRGTHMAVEILHRANLVAYYQIHLFTIPGHDAQPVLLGGIAIDVTERSRHAAALSLMASIVESSEDAIISKDLDGTILSWNPAAERIYGYAADEVIGRAISCLVPEDRREEEENILATLRGGGRLEHFETIRVRKDGKTVHVALTVSPIYNARKAIIGASHIARDITQRKRLEEKLRQTAKLESLGVLAGGVAHDFNNLLTGILGNASLALEVLAPKDSARELIEQTAEAAEKAAHLTRQLLAYAGKGRFVVGPVNLSDLVREMIPLIKTSISKNAELRLNLQNELPCIEADAAQIQQLIMNLIINGAEAIPKGVDGSVSVTTYVQDVDEQYEAQSPAGTEISAGPYVALEVHDTGSGMDEGTVARIFDPFFSTKFTGRGLGLAAAQGIVHGHKGNIKVYSTPGNGSTFKVLFPATGERKAEARPETRVHVPAATILVVDDEEVIRKTAVTALKSFGHQVFVAKNGREAVDVFGTHNGNIDVVILDLTMPVMGGEEALLELMRINSRVPIILSSGFNQVEIIERFTGKGIAGFLQKPYTAAALAAEIKRALERGMRQ
jgi:PAS domain S-box-containing protein